MTVATRDELVKLAAPRGISICDVIREKFRFDKEKDEL